MKWSDAAALAMSLLAVGPGPSESIAVAASLPSATRASQASDAIAGPTDISARRNVHGYHHHYRHGYRPYYPRYYARPYYYEPDPSYAPLPFGLSFGFGRW